MTTLGSRLEAEWRGFLNWQDILTSGWRNRGFAFNVPAASPVVVTVGRWGPEPNALPTQAADDVEMPLPSSPQTFFLGSLLALAVLAAVYVANSIILPVALAFVVAFGISC
jgi:hypothetical protein